MKIAFVGKGGAGKTTTASLFAQYQSKTLPTLAVDADINMHMAELLGASTKAKNLLISEKQPSEEIRTYLRGTNQRIESNAHFKKSTPPGEGSQLIDITRDNDWFMSRFASRVADNLSVVTVGSYSEDGIGSSCYHNNLSVLENVLTHTVDTGVIVADMVAGTDAFASTLFSQFDLLVFVVEPTKRSMAVFEQYHQLAEASGVVDKLLVIANKIEDDEDYAFIAETIGADVLVGSVSRSAHLLAVDKGRERLAFDAMSAEDQMVFSRLAELLGERAVTMQDRLPGLWELHKKYVAQGFIRERLGDLTSQIDPEFTYPKE